MNGDQLDGALNSLIAYGCVALVCLLPLIGSESARLRQHDELKAAQSALDATRAQLRVTERMCALHEQTIAGLSNLVGSWAVDAITDRVFTNHPMMRYPRLYPPVYADMTNIDPRWPIYSNQLIHTDNTR